MMPALVKVGRHAVNIAAVADAHWERDVLYLHFDGGRFAQLKGETATLVWDAIEALAIDLQARTVTPTGSVPKTQ